MTLEHLEQARRHVAEGERHIAHEREIIAEKQSDGHDTSMSKQLPMARSATKGALPMRCHQRFGALCVKRSHGRDLSGWQREKELHPVAGGVS
jgi:hypothetical protein